MATKFITPNWRMPKNSNQSKASNYSLDFDGSSYISLPSSLDLGTNSTISLWFKSDSGNANHTILGEDSYTYDYLLQVASAGNDANIRIGSVYKTFTVTEINDGNWNHWCIVRNGDSVELFINNSSKGTQTGYGTGTNTKFEKIGAEGDNQFPITGKIAQLSAFDYALTGSAVTALYNNGIPSNPLAVTTPPIAYYDLGQGSAYASGSAGIVEPNLAQATGSTVFEFDGPNANEQYITTTYFPNGETNFTYSTWLNCNFHQRGTPLAAYGGSTHQNFKVQFWTDTGGAMYVFVGGAYGFFANFSLHGYPGDKWTNISVVYDGTFTDADTATQNAGRLKLYINGNYEAFNSFNGTIPSTIPSGNTGFYLGTQTPTTLEYGGEMSNVMMFDNSLPATGTDSVETLYNNGTPLQSYTDIPQSGSLKAWYKLGLDNSIYNSDDTKWNVQNNFQLPIYNDSLKFFGSYIGGSPLISYPQLRTTTTSVSPGTNGITYSAFIRIPVPVQGNEKTLFYANLGSIQVSNKVAFKTEAGAKYKNFNKDLEDGAWHHVLVYVPTPSGTGALTDVKCYVDGEEITDTTIIGGSTYSTAITNIYGIYIGNLTPRHMEISNWAYWLGDKTSDVATIYNGGTPGDISSLNPDVWYKLDSNNVSLTGSNGLDYGSAVDSSGNGNNGRIGGESSDSETLRPVPIIVNNYPIIADNVVSSGMDSTNLVPSNLIKSIPYSGYSMDFDGANDYIDFGDSDDFSFTNNATTDLPFVLSWWLKPDSMNQNIGIAIKKDTEYQLKTDNVGRLKVTLFDSTSGGDIDAAITTNNWLYDEAYIWRNVIVTYDGSGNNTGIDIFLDGEHRGDVVRSGSGTYNFMRNSANSLINGDIGTFEFDGKQSNFAVWRGKTMMTGSSGDQNSIIRIYNGGSPGDLSSLNPTSWWSLGVDSYFDGSNWICPDLGGGGNNGTSANMAADDLVGDGPDSLANGTSTNLDLGSDLIGNAPGSTGNAISVNMNFTARTGSTP